MGKERVQLLEEGHQKIQVPHEREQILSFPSCSWSYKEYKRTITIIIYGVRGGKNEKIAERERGGSTQGESVWLTLSVS